MDADKKRIWVSGQTIEVTDEVYDAYMKGDRKMRYFENDLKTERIFLDEDGQIKQIIPSREDSLDRLHLYNESIHSQAPGRYVYVRCNSG